MTLRQFLDATYVFLIERFRDVNPDIKIEDAFALASGWEAGGTLSTDTAGGKEPTDSAEALRRREEEKANAEIDAMMSGTRSRRV